MEASSVSVESKKGSVRRFLEIENEAQILHSTILNNDHSLWVYTPPDYRCNGAPYDLLILFDGPAYIQLIPTPTILDHLLLKGDLPPLVAVFLSSPNRFLELACYQPFIEFLVEELMPWIHRRYHVTSNPAQTTAGGSSFGGLAAAYAGLRRPDIFGSILSQSGSFFWKPDDDGEHEWLARQFVASPTLPLRFYLGVGRQETWQPAEDAPTLLVANRHMRDVLQAKGYSVHYNEFNGDHNYLWWQSTLGDALIALIGRDKAQTTG